MINVPAYYFNNPAPGATPAPPPPRKIPNIWEVPERQNTELSLAIHGAHTCRMLGTLLKQNLNILQDRQLSFAIKRLVDDNLILDQYFVNEIVPITKEFVKVFNREHNDALGEIVAYFGWLQVNDESVWQLFEQKLVKERLYRYISLPLLVQVAHGLATANRGSNELWTVIQNQIVQHQKAFLYDEEMLDWARKAFELKGSASGIIKGVLANPTVDIQTLSPAVQGQKAIGSNKSH